MSHLTYLLIFQLFGSVTLKSQDGRQAIHIAAANGQGEIVKLLTQKYHVDPSTTTIVSLHPHVIFII